MCLVVLLSEVRGQIRGLLGAGKLLGGGRSRELVGCVEAGLDEVLALGIRDEWLQLWGRKGIHVASLRGNEEKNLSAGQGGELVSLSGDEHARENDSQGTGANAMDDKEVSLGGGRRPGKTGENGNASLKRGGDGQKGKEAFPFEEFPSHNPAKITKY